MTREEAIKILKESHEKGLSHTTYTVEQYLTARDIAVEALELTSPCDVCRYNPPSSGDGKPCTMCPAQATERFKDKLESGYFRKRREE